MNKRLRRGTATSLVFATLAFSVGGSDVHAASVHRGGFGVKAWVSPSSMSYDAYPTLYARTSPGAKCSASVVYSTGRTPVSFPYVTERANRKGMGSWAWQEETIGNSGVANVTCHFRNATKTVQTGFSVTS